jgi:hypothetical protein
MAVRNIALTHTFAPFGTASGMSLFASAQQYAGAISYKFTVPEWSHWIADCEVRREAADRLLSAAPDSVVPLGLREEMAVDRSYKRDALAGFRSVTLRELRSTLPLRFVYLWGVGDVWASGRLHHLVQLDYLLLAGLTFVGVWKCFRVIRQQWMLLIIPIYLTAIHTVFHVETRYSFPARPLLLTYAGVGIASILSGILGRFTPSYTRAGGPR